MTHLGWRVFTCDLCGEQFRFEMVAWENPNPNQWPRIIRGDVHDPDTDLKHRQHSVTHGGALDRQNAYCGPTTYSTHTEELTADTGNTP